MALQAVIPILYSSDIERSLKYYVDILEFENSWKWGDPPTFGGVYKGDLRIYFARESQGNPGTFIAIDVDDVDAYHERIKSKGANILQPPTTYEWHIREMFVKDPDDHFIRIGEPVSLRHKSEKNLPENIHIVARMPTVQELTAMVKSVGWSQPDDAPVPEIPVTSVAHTVVAELTDEKKIVGCAFLLTENADFYYVKNVIVDPALHGKQIGTAMMNNIVEWFHANAPEHASAYLHTGPATSNFYRHFGFSPVFSMAVRRKK